MRISGKSSLMAFFVAFGVLHVYQCLQAMAIGHIRRQIFACVWMLVSVIGLAVVKLYFML
jgi:hypothetical protein